jgi:hypothetical protein
VKAIFNLADENQTGMVTRTDIRQALDENLEAV